MMWTPTLLFGLVSVALGQGGLVIHPKNRNENESGGRVSLPLDLSNIVNNRAFAMFPGDANYDGTHSGIPAQFLPDTNFTYSGVDYIFPQYKETGNDNVLAQGQILTPPKGPYFSIQMLAAAEDAVATGNVTAVYSDNTTAFGSMLIDPWWAWPYPYGGDIIFPYHLTNSSIDYNRSMIFQTVNWLDSTKELVSLQLPNVTAGSSNSPGGAVQTTRLHIFAVSLVPANGTGISLEVQHARSTQTWFEGTNKTQIVEVRINNVGQEWILANNSVRVTIESPGLVTVIPGVVNRLRPGDQAIVQVGVVNTNGTSPGTTGEATVLISGNGVNTTSTFNATYGIGSYDATYESIYAHESTPWFNAAKYGIFIHWGVYSVPGWGDVGDAEQYAEWYWWYMSMGATSEHKNFYEYNLENYGPDHVYDDFIQNFTTANFDPKEWVDLFADAGAKYFVQVTKHHDGYALFDIPDTITNRTSVAQYPNKNLLQMLFNAAATYQPHLHRATYFSLPEWFHPDYKPYGFGEGLGWPGGNATNPYTNETLPYTGYVPVIDFIEDLVLPEMKILADMGTEIMWCDIGGPNMTAEFAASYFNSMAQQGKQVQLNNRCGLPGDFDTPEYARYDAVQGRKWESNLGMDPYSYGYNRATPDEAYITPQEIVTSLVDIVSKNGNFLLDIGPKADGSILEIEKRNLRTAGQWIKEHGEAIFNTTYWFITPEEGNALRFTQNNNAFYILTLFKPNETLVLDSPVPYVLGDEVQVLGGNMGGSVVPTRILANGSLELSISEEVRNADRFSWVFKIPFGGVEVDELDGSSVGGETPEMQTSGATKMTAGVFMMAVVLGMGMLVAMA